MVEDFQFGSPTFLLFSLFIGIIILAFAFLYFYRRRALLQFATEDLLEQILIPRSQKGFLWQVGWISFAWLLMTLALMDPRGRGRWPEEELNKLIEKNVEGSKKLQELTDKKIHEVIFLVDASLSMTTMESDLNKSRLDVVKEIVGYVISLLKGETVELYTFTSELIQEVPETMDYLFTRIMIKQIAPNPQETAGTDFLNVFQDLLKKLEKEPKIKPKTVVILTDGGDNEFEQNPEKASEREAAIIKVLKQISLENVSLILVGTGTLQGGNIPHFTFKGQPVHTVLEETFLKNLSESVQGVYINSKDSPSFELAEEISQRIETSGGINQETLRELTSRSLENKMIYDHYFQFFLALAALSLLFHLFWRQVDPRRISS